MRTFPNQSLQIIDSCIEEERKMQMTNNEIFEMISEDRIPPNFTRWGLRYPSGETVAHQAAYRGILPGDFRLWGLMDAAGRTVAQLAEYYGHLPECFPS